MADSNTSKPNPDWFSALCVTARNLAEQINSEANDYPSYSAAEDVIQEAEVQFPHFLQAHHAEVEKQVAALAKKLGEESWHRENLQKQLDEARTDLGILGDLCRECGGSGEITGDFDDQASGGLKVCPRCGGSGKHDGERKPSQAENQLAKVRELQRELESCDQREEADERRRVSHGMNGAGPHSASRAYRYAATKLAAIFGESQ